MEKMLDVLIGFEEGGCTDDFCEMLLAEYCVVDLNSGGHSCVDARIEGFSVV